MSRLLPVLAAAATAAVLVPTAASAHPHNHNCSGFVDRFCYELTPQGWVDCDLYVSDGQVGRTHFCWHA